MTETKHGDKNVWTRRVARVRSYISSHADVSARRLAEEGGKTGGYQEDGTVKAPSGVLNQTFLSHV